MELSVFSEISLIIAIATFVGLIMHLLKQPLIISYIITGIIVGPSLFNIVQSHDTVDVFAKIGISLLLFIIGLGLNPKVIKEVGKAAALTGVGQVLFTTIFGYGLIRMLGFESTEAIYIAIALTFSSTIIVLKLLSDKKEQGRLYGKISIGFLLVQDIIATFALVVAATAGDGLITGDGLLELTLKGIILGLGLFLFSARIIPHLSTVIAGSTEFLFLFALGWGFGIATLFNESGFSLEVGALFAGVALAPMVYAQEIASRLRPLRDFFIVLFFVSLGAGLSLDSLLGVLPQGIILSLFVLIGNPLIVIIIMGLLGYTKKTSFKAGLTVAQISEFSLVFILLGHEMGNVSLRTVSLITVVALTTIAVSTYMIIYADKLFEFVERYMRLFERRTKLPEREYVQQYDIMLFGYKKGGAEFAKIFERMNKKYVVIDYDPEIIEHMDNAHVPYIYGDVMDLELLEEAGTDMAKLILITVTDHPTTLFLVEQILKMNPKVVLICNSDSAKEAAELYALGATYVIMPHYIGSEKIGNFIKRNGLKKSEFKKFRENHLAALESSSELYN
jgi:Kef-type K+ transport system membrane component KefB